MIVAKQPRRNWGFTLVELLVVLAILAVLSAILFPVFRGARAAAHKSVCLSNLKQVQTTALMYLGDYDDTFPLVNYNPAAINDPTRDRTWVQLLMPYMRSFSLFTCPGDTGQKPRPEVLFDGDWVLGDAYQRYYRASLRVNTGYNYLYFSPAYRLGNRWIVAPLTAGQVADQAKSMMFLDSVYNRRSNGDPEGGGSYIVIPPCRFASQGNGLRDTFSVPNNATVFAPSQGWQVTDPNSPFRYGLAWPWHAGRLNVGLLGGGAQNISVNMLGTGCEVKNQWTGVIKDVGSYPWDNL